MKIFFILFQLTIYIYHLFIIENNMLKHDYDFFSLNYIISFIIISIYSIKKNGVASSSLFLVTYFVFVGSRVFLDFFGVSNLLETNLFYYTILKESTAHLFLFINQGLLFAFYVVIIFFRFESKKKYEINVNSSFYSNLKLLLKIIFPITLLLNIYSLNLILTSGSYLSIFNGTFEGDFLYNLSYKLQIFYNSLYIIFLASNNSLKSLNKYSKYYFINLLIFTLRGQRAMFLLFLILYLYIRNNNSKIRIKNILPIFASVLVLFIFVEYFRADDSQKNKFEVVDQFKFASLPAEVPLFLIEYNKNGFVNNSTPYFFTPIVDYFNRRLDIVNEDVFLQGRTIELLNKSNYLSNQLTYYLSKPAYLAGFGTGSSIIAEFYDMFNHRYFMILIGLFFLIIFKTEKLSNNNIYFKILWLVIFMSFIFSPRDSFLKFFQNFIPVLGILLLLRLTSKSNELHIKS